MLASKTGDAAAAILLGVSRPADVEATRPSLTGTEAQGVRVDSVGQAAAGGLLLSTAIVELMLGFWAAGWHYRAVALAVACVGVAFLTSGIAEIAIAVGRRSPQGTPGSATIDDQRDRSAL